MLHRNLLSALIAASLFVPSACMVAQTAPQTAPPNGNEAAPATPPEHPHRELPRPTNLQVLPKDISTQDLLATMHQIEGALGVHCSFCHAQNSDTHRMDFASDAKPEKTAARVMMRMTQDIDGKYLAQLPGPSDEMKVGCGTCHRGHSMPPAFTAAPEEHGPPAPPK